MTENAFTEIPEDVGTTSQLSNSWRLRIAHGNDIRYLPGIGWIAWDGNRWSADASKATQMCEKVTRDLYDECKRSVDALTETLKRIGNDKSSTAEMIEAAKTALTIARHRKEFARRSQSVSSFRDMLAHAETFPEMRVKPDAVDAKPYLLSVKNGTLDLSTATLTTPKREDFLTRQSPVAYDESVSVDKWVGFLMRALQDEETVEFLRLFAGYSLCGESSQELFLFVHGPPGNGKSTFIEALCSCLGDELTITIDFDTLCRKASSVQKYDTARMRGTRIVRTSESDRQQRLDEGLVCRWVGGERVRGRALYEDPFDFLPQFVLMMSVNGKPRINPDDQETGIWRRMICVHFEQPTIPDDIRDASIKKYWTDTSTDGGCQAVLKWAASGARDYIASGRLPPIPKRLIESRESYRQECDIVHRFMEECIVSDPDGFIPCEDFRALFVSWSIAQGEQFTLNAQQVATRILNAPWFAQKTRKRVNGQHLHIWSGIRRASLRDDPDDGPPASARRQIVQEVKDQETKVVFRESEDEDIEREAIVAESSAEDEEREGIVENS